MPAAKGCAKLQLPDDIDWAAIDVTVEGIMRNGWAPQVFADLNAVCMIAEVLLPDNLLNKQCRRRAHGPFATQYLVQDNP